MQVTFNTDSPSDVAFVRMILGIAAPVPAAPAASSGAPSAHGMPPLPLGAPAGSYWSPSVGAPMLTGPDGRTIGVDWSDPKAPKVVPPPTVQGGGPGNTPPPPQDGGTGS